MLCVQFGVISNLQNKNCRPPNSNDSSRLEPPNVLTKTTYI